MRVTSEADYAIRIVTELAKANKILGAANIAECVCVSKEFTLKILGKLMAGGLVESQKGKCGGYKLCVSPKKISMRDVIEIIDGPIEISQCLNKDNICSKNGKDKGKCTYHKIFAKINKLCRDRLSLVTIDMVIDDKKTTKDILKILD